MSDAAALPLSGLRVLDFGAFIAGPYAAQMLADMGAEVIKIEGPSNPDPMRGQGGRSLKLSFLLFAEMNRNKLGVCLDMSKPAGTAIFRKLARVSDIVIENFSPRVAVKLGLDYESLRQIRPDIIVVSTSGLGKGGPQEHFAATGPTIDAMSGMQHITGYLDGMPLKAGSHYTDEVAALHAVFAILMAVRHRNQTGQGDHLELSMRESSMQLIGEVMLDGCMNNRDVGRMGNRDFSNAPQGCYRCLGEDSWVTIAITSDQAWQRFCQAAGNSRWCKDTRFVTAAGRREHHDELDKLIEGWTAGRDKYRVMQLLQAAHIAAGAVLNPREVLTNENLNSRGYFQQALRPDGTTGPYLRLPWKVSGEDHAIRSPAPGFGQHNEYILRDVLGLSGEEVKQLAKDGIIGSA